MRSSTARFALVSQPSTASQKRRRGAARCARFEHLEHRHLLSATPIEVLAAGLSGQEQMTLEIDGVAVQTWNNVGGNFAARQFESFTYTHPTSVAAERVRVRFSGGSGTQNDLRVDGIRVGGSFYQSESSKTFSTGTWDSAAGACVPRFAQSEVLHCLNGYFDYGQADAAVLEVFAAGATGTETLALEIDGVRVTEFTNVGGNVNNRQFETLQYSHNGALGSSQVRLVLVDGTTNASGDRNLLIDAITINGQRFETEAASVFSVGAYRVSDGCAPGFKQSELLACDGYFQFGQNPNGGSLIDIPAAGATGQERMELQIDGVTVRTWDNVGGDYNGRDFVTYRYQHSSPVTADRVRVAFTNDGATAAGADKNLRVDGVSIDGVFFESEAANTLSTGTWTIADACAPGFKQSEQLHCNGYLQFNAPTGPTGVIGIGSTQFAIGETDGAVTVTFVRADGSSGPATVDFTTVPATATPGQDYVTRSGTVAFADGQTQASVDITILNDATSEGTETFNVAIDRVTGATAGQPRTTTVSIFDDEQPSAGSGNGLRGDYFTGQDFETQQLERTDLTVNFDWGRGVPVSGLPADNFSIRWTGEVQPLYSETYTFRTTTDDGVRLWIDDQLIIDQWVRQPATNHEGQITLTAGVRYDIRMEYNELTGEASSRLRWFSPSHPLQIIPTSQLYSDPITPTSGTFSGETIVTGLGDPTAIEFAPSGQMFIAQKNGIVRVYENGQLVPGSFIDLRDEVNNIQDRGLLGLELDPNFPAEPWVYLLYTYDPPETLSRSGLAGPDGAGNRVARLIRVLADAGNGYRTAVPGSEQILLGENSVWSNIPDPDQDGTNNVSLEPTCEGIEDCIPVDSRSHSIGALAFGTDGSLFVTNGDGTSFGRVDPRTVRVQDLDSLAGKVLRIDPDTGQGLTDNPFYEPSNPDSNQSKVYSYGLRNPFRMAINPANNEPYVSDVGWNTWEEINTGRGANFGWPFYEGGNGQNLQTGGYRDLPEAPAFYANNNAQPPVYSRSHANGGVAVIIGDFYTGELYPEQFQGSVFFTDFGDPTIRALRLAPNGSVAQELVVTGGVGSVVEMTMGPDGTMYYADLGADVIGRLRFNATASASLAVTPASDESSLAAAFAALGAPRQVADAATSPLDNTISAPAGDHQLLYETLTSPVEAPPSTAEAAADAEDDRAGVDGAEVGSAFDPALEEAFSL